MSKLRVGLIGFGSWVRKAYLPALQYDGRAVITAVTAATEKTRQLAGEILGNNVAAFDSYEDLLSHGDFDAVMIAVPDSVHQAVLTAALQREVAIFYEPPISHIRGQIPIMINRLLTSSQVTYAHLELCFHPGIEHAVNLIKSDTIGLLHNVAITLHADWGHSRDSDLCLMNRMSCWYVDVLNRIIGSIPKRVLVLDGYGCSGRMQNISTGIYDYNGIWGIFRANVSSPEGVSIIIEISGDKGDIYLNYFTGELRYRTMQHPEWIVEYISPLKPYADWPGVRENISSFLDCVISGEPSQGNAQTVAQLNLIGLASDKSIDTRGWVEVEKINLSK
ncbi:Gfo/Idh/MocA family protein [Anaerocolumna sp. MB42-C2]|uniref:Gfo/Idh/MocA family protein n=1 Tax=Anaerocolumna sp. MB42-C2 TaxID=3070997 RepID=UPI0027DEBE79|nr:Gfo/Idh/MocA family oxidoreductase [Anaerocolumna sp. MB42-C2]WMJ86831.1 Gfo/Idh/MocA family oxidoreductase [Anaerocolumna sp. MB42-C2]